MVTTMKSILSPYYDEEFNYRLYKLIKRCLRQKVCLFEEDTELKYSLDGKDYTAADLIKSVSVIGRQIFYNNQKLVNYAVYDLSQRFWYDIFSSVNNIIPTLYIKYKGALAAEENKLNKREVPKWLVYYIVTKNLT